MDCLDVNPAVCVPANRSHITLSACPCKLVKGIIQFDRFPSGGPLVLLVKMWSKSLPALSLGIPVHQRLGLQPAQEWDAEPQVARPPGQRRRAKMML